MVSNPPSEDLEELMKEYTTDPDYENIPELIPVFLKAQLWHHQYQMIHWMLKTESAGPILNDKGELFYARNGLQCSPTGTGKTATVLGVACYDVGEPVINDIILTTSLNTILLKPKALPMIQCTVICTDEKILDSTWMRDINTFYDPRLTAYRFETVSGFDKEIKNNPEYLNKQNYVFQLGNYMRQYLDALNRGSVSQMEFEVTMLQFGDIKNKADVDEFMAKQDEELNDLFDRLCVNALHHIMSNYRIFFVTKTSFHYLFKLFDHYRVARFIFDEPQGVTLTNQAKFADLFKDPRIVRMRSLDKRMRPYAEQSPFGFIWYVSATPNLIESNVDNHYFNSWVHKNDFLISDYSTNLEEKRMFPEMTKQYVVKVPYSHCLKSRPGYELLFNNYTLKAKRNAISAILHGVLGDDFDQMLENDDYEGFVKKLGNGGDVNTILQAAQAKLETDIKSHEDRIRLYNVKTPKHVVEKSTEELRLERVNLEDLKKKIARFHGQHANGTSVEECPICFNDLHVRPYNGMDPKDVCVAHMSCMNIYHTHCITDYMKADKNAVCPSCRGELSQENIKPTYDINGYNLEQQVKIEEMKPKQQDFRIDTEKEYDSKSDALKAALGPMERTVDGVPGYYRRQRVLLFIEFNGEDNHNLNEIVKDCQKFGYSVMLPFTISPVAELTRRFPPMGSSIVIQKMKDINKNQEKFNTYQGPIVWLFRSIKDAAGLNFPGADTLIMYSDFKHKVQCVGRAKRMTRLSPCDIFTIKNV